MNDIITYSFVGIIFLIPILFWNKIPSSRLSNISTTLGILGTFIGILIGLFNFNPNDLENSVPDLLGGLQTAFITSVTGIFVGLVIRNIKTEKVSDGSIAEVLTRSIVNLNDKVDELNDSIKNINKGLFNDDQDTSILTQLQKLRTVNNDGLKDMKKSFENFAEKVVADNTQSLIDALTEVMKDFNNKINEQFGENFKELNVAVKDLLSWQENYKSHVETLQDRYTNFSDGIQNVEITMEKIASNHKTIIEANKELNKVLIDFTDGVGTFSKIGEKASDTLPIIEDNLTSITKGLEKSYDDFVQKQIQIQENTKLMIENMITQNAERIKSLDENLGLELEKSLETLGSSLASLSRKFVDDYTPLTERLKDLLTNINR